MLDLAGSTTEALCDFLEVVAAANYPRPISITEAREIAAQHASVNEYKVNSAFLKLQNRKSLLGEKYPFVVTNEYIHQTNSPTFPIYLTFLALSGPGPLRQMPAWNLNAAAKIMERVVESCFATFFGSDTLSVNFGFPSEVNRPSEFGEAVRWLSEKTGIPVGSGYRPARYKDGGVDIFVWKAFQDKNPGVPILLLQCTIQEKFADKIGDVDRRLWASWLSSDIDPIVGLCVPNAVSSSEIWDEVTTRGLLFDRIRLVAMAPTMEAGLANTEEAFLKQLLHQFQEAIS
jgi:hypothetical protein